jgi:acetyl-CoA carboxylase biotin carboxyl carrier protein
MSMSGRSPFTNEDVEQILRLVDRMDDVEVTLESGDLRLHVRKGAVSAPLAPQARLDAAPAAAVPAAAPATRKAAAFAVPEGAVAIRAPMLGTFYRAPAPTAPPYVEAGTRVAAGDPLCVIEVMKLFNTVNAQAGGTILEVVAENGAMVEYGQVLFLVRPDA